MATPTHQKQTKDMHMPDDIIAEILPLLPANSLVRFRWVCKYWFNLITESSFVNKHLFRSNNYSSSSSRLWVLDYTKFSISSKSGMLTKCYIDYTTGLFSPQVTIPSPYISDTNFRFHGSCHGLILFTFSLYNNSKFCILNPCTNKYKEIPCAPQGFHQYPWYRFDYYSYGFGYDRTTDDYKVIGVAYAYSGFDGNDGYISPFFYVHTLGTNSWRSIGSIPYTLLPRRDESGVFVNGALYWRNYSMTKIISFDMGKERFEEITNNQPVCFNDNLKNGKLVMFEGSLSMLLGIDDPITGTNYAEMWVMKDNYCVNNNESSWTKLFRTKPFLACSFTYLKPLRFTKSGEIVLINRWGSLLSYDPKNPTATLIAISWGKEEHHTVWVEKENIVYIESLVSLNSGTYAVEPEQVEKQKKLKIRKTESMYH